MQVALGMLPQVFVANVMRVNYATAIILEYRAIMLSGTLTLNLHNENVARSKVETYAIRLTACRQAM